ncbi:cytosolic 5'-nucleotidase 1A-like isoform X2 [Acipenser ruthenus]|nr:cytosolic 5'-nucleotidase 1A-like isoform X2 [Acipenser ruthenus]XP_058857838.1 cytosolic 5'-nucleotidase 1A-like isoform X2 [Acipenser ruthenus]XP_058857840.1 cytosolic 5'-nucleotidase 1A-like isoform X2 [Acipenser ruthenus]XP_058857841.1 cytosolic 5'-nucleotidase 1A-like isoform X2 [Acipenser ruthenus]XP_058857842.1 cytosolic 5'-nucleotidase 1A-like isoform X2 [Acipenser ruthenus]
MEQCGHAVLNTEVKQKDTNRAIVIAVSSRAIFDLEEEHRLFLEKGTEEFENHQRANENEPLKEGTAFNFIKAAQMVNEKLLEKNPQEKLLFDVILVSNNSPQSGSRIINSAKHYGLDITRFCFVNEEDSTKYLHSNNVKLFLSADKTDVCNALKRGIPAAMVFKQEVLAPSDQLRVVFDGDAVLFSDETERIFREKGLSEAVNYEKLQESVPIGEGPLKEFAMLLGELRKKFSLDNSPLCIYLMTSRSNRDMSARAIRTLRVWGLEVDEAFFLDGAPKGPILSQIQPHIFFDDGMHHIWGAQGVGTPAALVPSSC